MVKETIILGINPNTKVGSDLLSLSRNFSEEKDNLDALPSKDAAARIDLRKVLATEHMIHPLPFFVQEVSRQLQKRAAELSDNLAVAAKLTSSGPGSRKSLHQEKDDLSLQKQHLTAATDHVKFLMAMRKIPTPDRTLLNVKALKPVITGTLPILP